MGEEKSSPHHFQVDLPKGEPETGEFCVLAAYCCPDIVQNANLQVIAITCFEKKQAWQFPSSPLPTIVHASSCLKLLHA